MLRITRRFSVAERRETITACYRQADSAQAFVNALEAAGYLLARGDQRSFVVVDIAGDVHSLARQIDGARTKDVKAKLAGIELARLPPVARARAMMAQRAEAQQDAARAKAKRLDGARAAAERLEAARRRRRAALDIQWQKMKIRHMHEIKVLLAHLKAEEELRLQRHWSRIGLARYLRRIAVIRQLLEYYDKKRRRSFEEFCLLIQQGLRRRHENEQRELRRRYEALLRLEQREDASYLIAFGAFATDSDGMAVRAVSSGFLYDDDRRRHRVTVDCGAVDWFAGWEDSALSLPEDFHYEPAAGCGTGSLSVTFNANAGWRAAHVATWSDEDGQSVNRLGMGTLDRRAIGTPS